MENYIYEVRMENADYAIYAGSDFCRAMRIVEDCKQNAAVYLDSTNDVIVNYNVHTGWDKK